MADFRQELVDARGRFWRYTDGRYQLFDEFPNLDPEQEVVNSIAITREGQLYDIRKNRVIPTYHILKQIDTTSIDKKIIMAISDKNELLRIKLKSGEASITIIEQGIIFIIDQFIKVRQGEGRVHGISIINKRGDLISLDLDSKLIKIVESKKIRHVGKQIKSFENGFLITSKGHFTSEGKKLKIDKGFLTDKIVNLVVIPLYNDHAECIIALDQSGNLFKDVYDTEYTTEFRPCNNGIINRMGEEDPWIKLVALRDNSAYVGLIARSGKVYEINSDFAIKSVNQIPEEIFQVVASTTKSARNVGRLRGDSDEGEGSKRYSESEGSRDVNK